MFVSVQLRVSKWSVRTFPVGYQTKWGYKMGKAQPSAACSWWEKTELTGSVAKPIWVMYIFLLYTEYLFFPQLYSHDSAFPTAAIGRGASGRQRVFKLCQRMSLDRWEAGFSSKARNTYHFPEINISCSLSPVETVLALPWPLTPL